jgi:hypothetical protein
VTYYPPGRRIDPGLAHRLGRVEAGLLAVVDRDRRGQEAVVDVRGAGTLVDEGWLPSADGAGPAYELEALVPTRVDWVDARPLDAAPPPQLLAAVLPVLAARTRRRQEEACRRRLQTGPQRVADQLVALADGTTPDGSRVVERLSRFDLARIVGLSRSAVSTFCADFERRGWCAALGEPGAYVDVDALDGFASHGLGPASRRPGDVRPDRHQASLWTLVVGEEGHAAEVA